MPRPTPPEVNPARWIGPRQQATKGAASRDLERQQFGIEALQAFGSGTLCRIGRITAGRERFGIGVEHSTLGNFEGAMGHDHSFLLCGLSHERRMQAPSRPATFMAQCRPESGEPIAMARKAKWTPKPGELAHYWCNSGKLARGGLNVRVIRRGEWRLHDCRSTA